MVTLPKTEKYMKDHKITIDTIICIDKNETIQKTNNNLKSIILVRTTLTTIKYYFKENKLTIQKLVTFLDEFLLSCLKKDFNTLRNPFCKFSLQMGFKHENIIVLPYYTGFLNNDLYTFFTYEKII